MFYEKNFITFYSLNLKCIAHCLFLPVVHTAMGNPATRNTVFQQFFYLVAGNYHLRSHKKGFFGEVRNYRKYYVLVLFLSANIFFKKMTLCQFCWVIGYNQG